MNALGFGPNKPIRVVTLRKTCNACPAQFEGMTDHGAAFYARFRQSRLRVHVGPGIDEAIDRDPVFTWIDEDDPQNGFMTEEELRAVLPDWIVIEATA